MRINILLFLCFSTCMSAAQAQWNMFKNLDFSMDADSLSTKAYWRSMDHVSFSKAERMENGKSNPCLKIYGTYEGDRSGFVYQQYPVHVSNYVKLRVTAQLKGEDLSDGKAYIYSYTKKGEQWLQYKSLESTPIKGTTDWQEMEFDIWVEPQATTLRIGAAMQGTGSFMVDNFEVQEIPMGDCPPQAEHVSFMKECMDLIGQYSLFKAQIDTAQLMSQWQRITACSKDITGIHDGLSLILRSIDNHSFYWSAEQVNSWQNTSSDAQAAANVLFAKGHNIDDQYAYIWMPHFGSGDSITQILFADKMQQLIDSLDHKELKGWVLDLRDNGGGNCWPMLAGIGPILGEGVCGYFQEGDEYHDWSYAKGASMERKRAFTTVSIDPYEPYSTNPKVAVLIGPMTGSSGEVVAIAFKNRPQTKLFGLPTAGYSTGNVNHTLSDGSMLFLAQSVYADRDKNAYPKGLNPDVEVAAGEGEDEDKALEEAVQWLKSNNP